MLLFQVEQTNEKKKNHPFWGVVTKQEEPKEKKDADYYIKKTQEISQKVTDELARQRKEKQGFVEEKKKVPKKVSKKSGRRKEPVEEQAPPKPQFGEELDEKLNEFLNGNSKALKYLLDMKSEDYAKFNDYFGLLGENHTPDYERLQEIMELINAATGEDARFKAFTDYIEKNITGKDKEGKEVYEGGEQTFYSKGYKEAKHELVTSEDKRVVVKTEYERAAKRKAYFEEHGAKGKKKETKKTYPDGEVGLEEPTQKEVKEEPAPKETEVSEAMKQAADRIDAAADKGKLETIHRGDYQPVLDAIRNAREGSPIANAYNSLADKEAGVLRYADMLPLLINSGKYSVRGAELEDAIAKDLAKFKGTTTQVTDIEETAQESAFSGAYATGTAWFDALGKDAQIRNAFNDLSEDAKKAFIERAGKNIADGTYAESDPELQSTVLRHLKLVKQGES